jgi:hypothetical protein
MKSRNRRVQGRQQGRTVGRRAQHRPLGPRLTDDSPWSSLTKWSPDEYSPSWIVTKVSPVMDQGVDRQVFLGELSIVDQGIGQTNIVHLGPLACGEKRVFSAQLVDHLVIK